jgi:hypothetical protein
VARSHGAVFRFEIPTVPGYSFCPWSDREIGRRCHVGGDLVGRLREKLRPVTVANHSERTYKTKHGTTAKMRTGNVGRSAGKRAEAETNEEKMGRRLKEAPDLAGISLDDATASPTA